MLAAALFATALTIARDRPLARFDPQTALGATLDAHGRGETEEMLTRANVAAMESAGFHPLSYRLATELCGEAWHWNPRGRWSDAAHIQGYWISSDDGPPIVESYGYHLPRRGNTIDQAHNRDYSRIDDGDPSTFWKSNPYVDGPQWVLIDLGTPQPVDALRIRWGRPYAAEYQLQHWSNGTDPLKFPIGGDWVTFDRGAIRNGTGGIATHAVKPETARFLRVLMTRSAGGPQTRDWRDAHGYAMAEIEVLSRGRDVVRHAKSHAQTVIWVSTTDPWHRAIDIDRSLEQPGFDRVVATGLTHGLPMLTPVAMLYGTPEDAAAEIRYLKRRRIPVTQIEMGEEPDGQNVSPEDYAALYVRWSVALHAVDPTLQLGGPAFQSTRDFVAHWRNEKGETSWIGRFLAALERAGHSDDYRFFSFEWYPVDDVCGDAEKNLADSPALLRAVIARWRKEGLPESMPLLATEYGWSSYGAEEEVDLPGALFNIDFLADFLTLGGTASYFYGLEPEEPISESNDCESRGNLMLFLGDEDRNIVAKLPSFWTAQLVMTKWLAPRGVHELYAVEGTDPLLRAWAVRRPDGSRSMLIINKDASESRRLRIDGATSMWQYSARDYKWDEEREEPAKNVAPHFMRVDGSIDVPPWSVTVVEMVAR